MRYILTKKNCLKKIMPLLLTAVLGLSGCGGESSLFTDAGTDVVIQAQREDYLDLKALEGDDSGKVTFNGYEVHTLSYGDFETESAAFGASIDVLETTVVRAEYSTGTMRLVQQMDLRSTLVKKGDVIALVSMETNELDLEELELSLKRVRERYEAFKADYETDHQEMIDNLSWGTPREQIDRLKLYQMELSHIREDESYRKQIESYEKRVEELKALMNTTEIVAPVDGIVTEINRELVAGQKLENGTMLAKIIPSDQIYMTFEDNLSHYAYGNEMTFIVGRPPKSQEFSAKIVSTNGKALSSDWYTGRSYILSSVTPFEVITQGPFYVKAITNVMKNVLLIPHDSVTSESGKYFVTVLHEDGTLEKTQFLSGGNNTEYYWVYDGLEEGTKVLIYNN